MLKVDHKSDCCGCGACIQICPKHCISFIEDYEGFLYPSVNTEYCIDCKLCEKVCPILNINAERLPLLVEAAQNINDTERIVSSSGGIFVALAKSIYKKGGYVVGTILNEKWEAVQVASCNQEDIQRMMGSKYVQSKTEDTFLTVKKLLKQGICVLYSGTPCQVAGLNKYLQQEYEYLLAVDFVCHGVPSPGVWREYLNEFSKNIVIQSIEFRNKTKRGWKKFSFLIHGKDRFFKRNICFSEKHHNNLYMKAFLSDLILRPSCYSCPVKCFKSQSDITVADFWNAKKIYPQWVDDDKGASIIFINTEKGKRAIDAIRDKLEVVQLKYETVEQYNTAITKSARYHINRHLFFEDYAKKKTSINKLFLKYCYTPKERLKQRIKIFVQIVKSYCSI